MLSSRKGRRTDTPSHGAILSYRTQSPSQVRTIHADQRADGRMRAWRSCSNGAPTTHPGPADHRALLDDNGLAARRVAIEVNGTIVPRSDPSSTHAAGR